MPGEVEQFKHHIENWASNSSTVGSKLVFESKLEDIEDVVDKLIPPLCKKGTSAPKIPAEQTKNMKLMHALIFSISRFHFCFKKNYRGRRKD